MKLRIVGRDEQSLALLLVERDRESSQAVDGKGALLAHLQADALTCSLPQGVVLFRSRSSSALISTSDIRLPRGCAAFRPKRMGCRRAVKGPGPVTSLRFNSSRMALREVAP